MIYVILVCLYAYLILKVLFSLVPKGRELAKKVGPKLSIIEFFIIALVLSYLFNYYYLQTSEFKSFIVPVEVIWLSFASSILLFGIAVGARFILNLVENFIPNSSVAVFSKNKEIYDVFTLIWLNLSTLMIFFSYCLMEISRPIERIDNLQNALIILGLSSLLGLLFYFLHKEINFLVKRITVIGMALMSVCLVLFIYQSRTEFITNMPFTTSFIVFNITFFVSLIVNTAFNWRRNNGLKVNFEKKDIAAKENLVQEEISSNQQIFNSYQETKVEVNYVNNSNLLYAKSEEIQFINSKPNNSSRIELGEEKISFEDSLLNEN